MKAIFIVTLTLARYANSRFIICPQLVHERLTPHQEKRATAGKDWFNLPATDMTSELKRDLQVLSMRNILDPKRHYKKSKNSLPQFSQVGILKEGATEFYSARIPNSQRNRSLVEEVLAGERETGRFKRKYDEVQATKRSGKKGHYKSLMAKKYGKNLRQ